MGDPRANYKIEDEIEPDADNDDPSTVAANKGYVASLTVNPKTGDLSK